MPTEVKDQSVPSGGYKLIYATGNVSNNDSATAYLSRSKRNRLWNVQNRPYVKTLPYYDKHTKLVDVKAFDEAQWTRSSASGTWKLHANRVGYPWIAADAITYVEKNLAVSTSAAKYRVLDALQDAKWNLALFVAESDAVVDMIASTARTLTKAYKAVRKGKFKKAARALGITTPVGQSRNSWLAYRYGWMPLLGDVASAAEAAASVLYKRPETQRVQCRGPKTEKSWTTRYASNMGGFLHGSGFTPSARDVTFLERSESKAWLTVECKSSALMRLEQFGLANPLALAWELVPFSFVADWFVGIGDYLNAQTALVGLKVLDGGVSTLTTSRVSSQRLYPGTTIYNKFTGSEPAYTVECRNYRRDPWFGEIPSPTIDINLNLKRILDSAALIHAVFGKR